MKHFLWILIFSCSFTTLFSQIKTDTVDLNIDCEGLSYKKLQIIWVDYLPRTGIITNCEGKKHTVNYFSMDVNSSREHVFNPPVIINNELKYADRNVHQFKIMNAFTGAIDTTILTEPTTDYIVRDLAVMLKDTKVKPPPEAREHITYLPPAYKLYSFETLPAGVYIIALFNEKDEIINVKTYRKN